MGCAAVEDAGFEPQITFSVQEDRSIAVVIETARLVLKSVEATEDYREKYVKLFGDREVMKTYGNGLPKDRAWVVKVQNMWANRWKEGDPYSGFAIFKKETNEFIGHIACGHTDDPTKDPGQTVLGYLLHKEFWNQKYGTEAVSAVVHQYAPALIQRGYLIDGARLREVVATTLPANTASIKLQQNIGMQFKKAVAEYGATREMYSYSYNA